MKNFFAYPIWLAVISSIIYLLFSGLFLSKKYTFDGKVTCISYDPRYRFDYISIEELGEGTFIEKQWIEDDLKRIKELAGCVRTYSTTKGMEKLPEVAKRLGLEVMLGVSITDVPEVNNREMTAAIDLANRYDNIRYVLVGNEIILAAAWKIKKTVPFNTLVEYVKTAAAAISQPVSSPEVTHNWKRRAKLVDAVDFIAVNKGPYWAKINATDTTLYLNSSLRTLQKLSKGKPIIFTEIGWPTTGPVNGDAQPGGKQFEIFFDQLVAWSARKGVTYSLFEAFDQPWKRYTNEGRIGPHWGLLDASGDPKFGERPNERIWLWAAAAGAAALSIVFLTTLPVLNSLGLALCILTVHLTVYLFVLTLKAANLEYILGSLFFTVNIIPAEILLFILVLVFLREGALIIGGVKFPSQQPLSPAPENWEPPFVSIHVPCSNEPPGIVIECISSLLELNYANFEILLIDNNTADETLWRPLEKFCATGPARLKFFHVENLPGFKSGALNFALRQTDARAAIIAVVDADYKVSQAWLKDLAPLFTDERIAAVQAPQANRDWQSSFFKRALRDEYEGFFRTGMVVRDAANALIQHGSMILMRRSAIDSVGGWDEQCITEDTELGLRFLLAGFKIRYVCKEYGAGLIPANYNAYCAQRSRWVQGAMQILKRHKRSIFGRYSDLNARQRYHFIAGWLPWVCDIFAPLFTALGLALLGFMFYSPLYFPPVEFSFPIIFYVLFRHSLVLLTYVRAVRVPPFRALISSLAGLSLTNTIAYAVMKGVLGKRFIFKRTEKGRQIRHTGPRWFSLVRWDALPGIVLTIAAPFLVVHYGFVSQEALLWAIALSLLGLAGASVALMQLLSYFETRGTLPGRRSILYKTRNASCPP